MDKILIAYESKTGSTKEVALAMAKALAEAGKDAEALPLAAVKGLGAYSKVIIGAPINGMRWLPEAVDFVGSHRNDLAGKKVSYFLLGVSLMSTSEKVRARAAKAFEPAEALVKPERKACFGGFMSADPPAILRFFFKLPKDCPRDGRDWDAIKKWAREA